MRKEIPILFSTSMVQAFESGRKQQTRRTKGLDEINENPNDWQLINYVVKPLKQHFQYVATFKNLKTKNVLNIECPYGVFADLFWIRETYLETPNAGYCYKAITDAVSEDIRKYYLDCGAKWAKWKPSIHMPKIAARLWAQNCGVNIHRLHDISYDDCIAEGVELGTSPDGIKRWKCYETDVFAFHNPITSFRTLWEKINGTESWASNPWVWTIKFIKINPNHDNR